MSLLSRRAVLRTATALVGGTLILSDSACSTQQLAIAQEAVTVAGVIANAAALIVPGAGIAAAVANYAADAIAASQKIVAGMQQTAAQPLAVQIETDVNNIITGILTPAPGYTPPAAGSSTYKIITDLQTALPLLLAAVGVQTASAALGPQPDRHAALARLQALPKAKLRR
jgi:hypothetical protein